MQSDKPNTILLIVGLWVHFLKGMAFGALLSILAILVLVFVLWVSAWL